MRYIGLALLVLVLTACGKHPAQAAVEEAFCEKDASYCKSIDVPARPFSLR